MKIVAHKNGYWISENGHLWDEARKIAPKKKRLMTHAEIFKAQRDGAVFMSEQRTIFSFWSTNFDTICYRLCYNYTGTETDVWKTMELEE